MPDYLTNVEHIVVLMLENRSYDHMLGFAGTPNGLTGSEFNPEDPADPNSPSIPVSDDAAYTGDLVVDPSHDVRGVNFQLFGTEEPEGGAKARNNGFVLDYARQAGNNLLAGKNIMKCFKPSRLPVLTTLAREFAVCDRWFCSVPGPTWPNRLFSHAATSDGSATNAQRNFRTRTIFENLSDAGFDWGVYFHDIASAMVFANLSVLRDNFKFFPSFYSDLEVGLLPSYSFLEPRYFNFLGSEANDQHPPHDVRLGEALIADVYEAIRNSSYWDRTLLVIVYDEHGGIFDHMAPPDAVSPDGLTSSDPRFSFERLGPRVPAILVSAYIPKGLQDTTLYDHTSLLATVKELFMMPRFLTNRDRLAKTFSHNLSLSTPRTDAPTELVRPTGMPPTLDSPATLSVLRSEVAKDAVSRAPLSDLQKSLLEVARGLDIGETEALSRVRAARTVSNEHDAAVEVQDIVTRYLEAGPSAGVR